MYFDHALRHLRDGKRLSRDEWGKKGVYIELVSSEGSPSPSIVLHTSGKTYPWVIFQADVLAGDWRVDWEIRREPVVELAPSD